MAPDCDLIPPESVESSISSIETVPKFIPANKSQWMKGKPTVLQVLQVQKLGPSKLRDEIINKTCFIPSEWSIAGESTKNKWKILQLQFDLFLSSSRRPN